MDTTKIIKIASNMKMTSKWRQQEKWTWFKIEDDLQKENVILKTIPGPSLYDLSRHCCYQFCSIFMQVYEEFILSIGQCSTNIKFCTQYIFEYICKKITNIEYIRNRTAYRIRISNIFVSSNLAEYEYRIYLFLVTWPNTNIEYIRNQKIKYSYSNI